MINKKQLTAAEQEHWNYIKQTVEYWARVNVPEQYNYNSRATYWRSALSAQVIDQSMYDYARDRFGNLWDYTGD